MNKKLINIAGLTLIEILIAIVITSLMMAAMVTSYNLVNSTYRQVTDRAKISQAGRDVVGTMLREIRMAGFKYMGDMIVPPAGKINDHNPIRIYKNPQGTAGGCDVIEIVYGGIDYSKPTPGVAATKTHTRYKITYQCNVSKKKDLDTNTSVGYQLLKSKGKWNGSDWNYSGSGLYKEEQVLDFLQDLVFIPYDEKGKIMKSKSSGGDYWNKEYYPSNEKTYDLRTVDIALIVRSTKKFYKNKTIRKILSIASTSTADKKRDLSITDRYFRDTIAVTANARNVGLE